MKRSRRFHAVVLAVMIVVAGCGEDTGVDAPPIDVSDEELAPQIATWVNMLGLAQTDPEVWRERLGRACTDGVWDPAVAIQLAAEFMDEDEAVSIRGEGSETPTVEDGALALWLMAVNVCRDAFPDAEIEEGIPTY